MSNPPPRSRFFSLLSLVFGLGAALLGLFGFPWGALGLGSAALVATGVALLRNEGLGALAGAAFASAAMLGPEAVLGALLLTALILALINPRSGTA